MSQKVLLITPPFTQLNTPYPATAYLKGFLNQINVPAVQCDLGIEVINALFSTAGLQAMFNSVAFQNDWSENCKRIFMLQQQYIDTIAVVIEFLQGKNNALAPNIISGNFLPQAGRFDTLGDLEWLFGTMGQQDKAKHLTTLYLEDIADFITTCVDSNFGFSRYAERLGASAYTFDNLAIALNQPLSYIDAITIQLLEKKIQETSPTLVALSIPFPGNLFSGLRIGQYIKQQYPSIKIVLGGGYANTELRSLSDTRVFNFLDFILLDDGEAPLQILIDYLNGNIPQELLKRCFLLDNAKVTYVNGSIFPDYNQAQLPAPDYSDLPLDTYISVIEVANPMHALWSDGRWNKLTLAHGCYWGKCTFCDISLDYIRHYEKSTASLLVDKIESLIEQTNTRGFHFVDEAAPPALMKELALELIKRKVQITWWTNIRFEKNFTQDICLLLAASGCIAVSGGLEVASDRLLQLMEKGVTVAQVAKVADNFTNAGIMVHAYLMYGFPTQTVQETIDALEHVRQLIECAVIQSGFWHQFAMTAHSPIGLNPSKYNVQPMVTEKGSFANNDIPHLDPTGCNHTQFSAGLKKALYNYMHGIGLDFSLQEWFDFKVPKTTVHPTFIQKAISQAEVVLPKISNQLVWLHPIPTLLKVSKKNKHQHIEQGKLVVVTKDNTITLSCDYNWCEWLLNILTRAQISASTTPITFAIMQKEFEATFDTDFILFLKHPIFQELRYAGLLIV